MINFIIDNWHVLITILIAAIGLVYQHFDYRDKIKKIESQLNINFDKQVSYSQSGIENSLVVNPSVEEIIGVLKPFVTKDEFKAALTQAETNYNKLSQLFFKKIDFSRLENKDIMTSPDFVFNLKYALDVGSRFDNDTLHMFLAFLIDKRLKSGHNDSKSIIISESILTIAKLTPNQLKILTFTFLLYDYVRFLEIQNWEQYNAYIEDFVVPFMDFEIKSIDTQHLDYTRCIKIDEAHVTPELSATISFRCNAIFRDVPIKERTKDNILALSRQNVKRYSQLQGLVQNLDIYAISPTSVGIMLASINYEIITGKKLSHIDKYYL